MLVLSRKRDESIVIVIPPSNDVQVVRMKVTDFQRDAGRAKLGFEAPESIRIHRQEVYDDIMKTGGEL